MDDVDSGPGGEREDLEDLLGELAYEVEADAGEVPVLEELDQVEAQHLEDEAPVVPVHEGGAEADDVLMVVRVVAVEVLQQPAPSGPGGGTPSWT